MLDTGEDGSEAVSDEMNEMDSASHPQDVGDTDHGGSGSRRLSCLAVVLVVLALVAGGFVWLFQDELFHPFGDARACAGSDTMLPGVIELGAGPIPADASDIHYATKNGRAQVSFLTSQMPEYLHRTGTIPEGEDPFGEKGARAAGLGEAARYLPDGLCGPVLEGPAFSYTTGPGVDILVEVSPITYARFRVPARVIATFRIQ